VPHLSQNFRPTVTCDPHLGHATPGGETGTGPALPIASPAGARTGITGAYSPEVIGVAGGFAGAAAAAIALGAVPLSGLPQLLQNLVPWRFAVPQYVQEMVTGDTGACMSAVSGIAHFSQEVQPGCTSAPHCGQC
jgi:hypothetical protein